MKTMYWVVGGKIASPGSQLPIELRRSIQQSLRLTEVGRADYFDVAASWRARASEELAALLARGAKRMTLIPEMGPRHLYRLDYGRYSTFMQAHPGCTIAEEASENSSLFTCLGMHIKDCVAQILGGEMRDDELGLGVLPHPIAEIAFAQSMKEPRLRHTFRQGQAFKVNYNNAGVICDPAPCLINSPTPPA